MFGYVMIDKPELKVKDFELYRSFYCGLCRELREKYGIRGQISLNYDMTFVVLLLSALYESPVRKGTTRCAVHPAVKQQVRKTEFTSYGADMNILLMYYKCMDDWTDEKKLLKRSYAALLSGRVRRIEEQYPGKASRIREALAGLSAEEKAGQKDPDVMAGLFGRLLEEIFAWKEDVWEGSLRRIGFFLGKYIYLLDAFEDLEKDQKEGSYNLFAGRENLKQEAEQLLVMMLSEACREFECLPILRYGDILRNILYSGIWGRYRTVIGKRGEEQNP